MKLLSFKSKNERNISLRGILYKKIQKYIKCGSYGDLYLRGSPILELPNFLKIVIGDLVLSSSSVSILPENLHVTGDLILFNCGFLEKLPNNLRVDKSLDIDFCVNLNVLPVNLQIGNTLYCRNTGLKSVDLLNTKIKINKIKSSWVY